MPRKAYDVGTALVAADAFRQHAHIFLNAIGTDMEAAHHRAIQRLGELIASATELTLAVELYLKILWMRLGLNVPETHDLWSLFKNLPNEQLRTSIIKAYDNSNPVTGSEVASLELAISVGPFQEDQMQAAETERTKKKHGPSLKAVLLRCSNGFQAWRYLHEQGKPGQVRLVEYEFARLDTIAEVVRAHGAQGLGRVTKSG